MEGEDNLLHEAEHMSLKIDSDNQSLGRRCSGIFEPVDEYKIIYELRKKIDPKSKYNEQLSISKRAEYLLVFAKLLSVPCSGVNYIFLFQNLDKETSGKMLPAERALCAITALRYMSKSLIDLDGYFNFNMLRSEQKIFDVQKKIMYLCSCIESYLKKSSQGGIDTDSEDESKNYHLFKDGSLRGYIENIIKSDAEKNTFNPFIYAVNVFGKNCFPHIAQYVGLTQMSKEYDFDREVYQNHLKVKKNEYQPINQVEINSSSLSSLSNSEHSL